MIAKELICFECKHFNLSGTGCNAFPEGIPPEITSGENNHSKPLKGQDNDIVFEPIEEEDNQWAR